MSDDYHVYAVIYESPDAGLAAVAVSAASAAAARRRLADYGPVRIIDVVLIEGREPEFAQDRIEGTVDLFHLQAKPPEARSPEAETIRAANARYITDHYGPGGADKEGAR